MSGEVGKKTPKKEIDNPTIWVLSHDKVKVKVAQIKK